MLRRKKAQKKKKTVVAHFPPMLTLIQPDKMAKNYILIYRNCRQQKGTDMHMRAPKSVR